MKDKKELEYFNYNGHLNDETIALYAKRILTKDETLEISASVIAHFEECEDCKTEILDFVEVMSGNYNYLEHLSVNLEEPTLDKIPEQPASKIRRLYFIKTLRIGAMAALVVVFAAISWWAFRPVTPEKLFEQYFSPYSNILTTKGSGAEKLAQGLLFYDLKMYDSAVAYFSHALPYDTLNQDVRFYLANALLASGKAIEAIPLFVSLQISPECKYCYPARWLLGLAWLKADNPENAKQVFGQIVNEPNFYSGKAEEILKKLK